MLFFLIISMFRIQAVTANTEKVIFLAPSSFQAPVEHHSIEDLQLQALSPQYWSLRTLIQAEFPTNTSKYGQSSWVLLHRLQEGQRYEVRICWAATQPTSFRLDTYEVTTVFETPELITSLAQYSESRQPNPINIQEQQPSLSKEERESEHPYDLTTMMFLHILAAADFYTMNQTLMEQVPPVLVDIILDPYLFNVFPRSLVPTAAYIFVLAIGSWHLSKYISGLVQTMTKDEVNLKKTS